MKNYRYDISEAFEAGVHVHPQLQIKNLGYEVIKSEPVSIAECWLFRVNNEIEETPDYLYEMGDDFKFSDER